MTDWSRSLTSDINVTPFLDVLLVLMITFLASVTARKSMDVQLPVPCQDICASSDQAIVLEVLADGTFLLNTRPVRTQELFSTLRSVYADRPEKVIQVAGHRNANYQAVLAAMDVARSAGVKVVSIPPSTSYSSR
ncbi:MAG: biopolymer transporter ExbD [Gemmatimonadaceae bacterium]